LEEAYKGQIRLALRIESFNHLLDGFGTYLASYCAGAPKS